MRLMLDLADIDTTCAILPQLDAAYYFMWSIRQLYPDSPLSSAAHRNSPGHRDIFLTPLRKEHGQAGAGAVGLGNAQPGEAVQGLPPVLDGLAGLAGGLMDGGQATVARACSYWSRDRVANVGAASYCDLASRVRPVARRTSPGR
jgi:hypothetical protein